MQLGRVRINFSFGVEKRLLSGIELDPSGPALAHQRPLPVQVVSRFVKGGDRRGKRGLRGTQSVLLRLRVEFGDQVARLNHSPDVDLSSDHPPIDTESEAFLRARADMARERYRFPLS